MVDIQSPTADIRQGKKKEKERKRKYTVFQKSGPPNSWW